MQPSSNGEANPRNPTYAILKKQLENDIAGAPLKEVCVDMAGRGPEAGRANFSGNTSEVSKIECP